MHTFLMHATLKQPSQYLMTQLWLQNYKDQYLVSPDAVFMWITGGFDLNLICI